MIITQTIPFRGRRRRSAPAAPPTPAGLTLVAATYDADAQTLRLAFDRAIDIAGLNGGQIEVDDGTFTDTQYLAVGDAALVDPVTLEVGLLLKTTGSPPGVYLNVSPGCGIVAVDGSGQWGAVFGVALPYP